MTEKFEEAVREMAASGMTRREVYEAADKVFDAITAETAASLYGKDKSA